MNHGHNAYPNVTVSILAFHIAKIAILLFSNHFNLFGLVKTNRYHCSVVIDAVEIMLARYDFKLSNRLVNVWNEKLKPDLILDIQVKNN